MERDHIIYMALGAFFVLNLFSVWKINNSAYRLDINAEELTNTLNQVRKVTANYEK